MTHIADVRPGFLSPRVEPRLFPATAGHRGVLVWQWGTPMPGCVLAAPVGGGPSTVEWVLNVGVRSGYDRTDLSEHAREVADELNLGEGVW